VVRLEGAGAALGTEQILILIPPLDESPAWLSAVEAFLEEAQSPVHLALVRRFDGGDGARLMRQSRLAHRLGVPTVASTDALYHAPERRLLQDVVTCIREHVHIDDAGRLLEANAERHLKAPEEMERLFAGYEDAVARSAALAETVAFQLDQLVYHYPDEVIGKGETPLETLHRLVEEGMARRWPDGVPDKTKAVIDYELKLIEELDYASYFLTVYDLVRYARSEGILCQGRGSAANSAVCYTIGITEVDPVKVDLLFERFISAERGEPPDIDVDFEHERREEVIQYVYRKYGRRRAGMTAVVHCYRPRGAIREAGKVFGLSGDVIAALSKAVWGWREGITPEVIRTELGLDPDSPALKRALGAAKALQGFPRHLSQHPGGFVITLGRLDDIVPVRKAAMPERTAIEWDKEDIEALGLMKVDVLGLGMLTAVQKSLDLILEAYGRDLPIAAIPPEDQRVYDMICKADTLGVFQIESRAQMTMLPRLKPRCFYDLVIEVAIVRPGPIQGDMVHPYLRRREGREVVDYPSDALRQVLGKTLGVPLFQEQAMKIAIVAAGFTPSEADRLRRSMAAFRRSGTIQEMGEKLVKGMIANGYAPDFAERCFKQLEGFGEYGFPESHAASFALIVYASCWIKRHYPDAFLAAMLNSQPLGFYAPAQLVRDAREHGVIVRPPDINHSDWDCTLEPLEPGERPALTPAQVRMHHVALDRAGAHDGDLDHKVVEAGRLEARQHGHLRPRLDLEHADRIGALQHAVGGGVLGGDVLQAADARLVAADQDQGLADRREHAQGEDVDLEQAEGLDVLLVPLDYRALGHGGVLHRYQLRDGAARDHEAADMLGQVAGKAEDFLHQAVEQACRVFAAGGFREALLGEAFFQVALLVPPSQGLGEVIDEHGVEAEGATDIAHGAARAVGDERRRQGRAAARVFIVDVLDDLLATLVLEVDVDVRRFVSLAGDKALEEQGDLLR
jgi:error-prone DNA polymerase